MSLLDYLVAFSKHGKLIFFCSVILPILALGTSFLFPKTYRAESRVMPPQNSSSMKIGMISQVTGIDLSGFSSGSGTGMTSDIYAGMLKSSTILDRIIDRFGLISKYGAATREDARRQLSDDIMDVSVDSKSGIVTVGVQDKDPRTAAQMANAFVDELEKTSNQLNYMDAKGRMDYLEAQVNKAKENLTRSEEDMKKFMEKTGVLQIDDQARAILEGIAALNAQVAAKEVEINVMKTFSMPQNPDLQMAEEELRGLSAQLAKLEARKTATGIDPILPTANIPSLGTDYERKLRDQKYYEALYQFLAKEYESARLDEARNYAGIQVLDSAVPPTKKYKPQRLLITLVTAAGGFFISIFASLVLEYVEKAKQDRETREKLDLIKGHLRLRKNRAA